MSCCNKTKEDGGQAFPNVFEAMPQFGIDIAKQYTQGGMTLRDYFATERPDDLIRVRDHKDCEALIGEKTPDPNQNILAYVSFVMKVEAFLNYQYADAMLEERKR